LIPKDYRFGSSDYLQNLDPVIDRSLRIFAIDTDSPFPDSLIALRQRDDAFEIFGAEPTGRDPRSYETAPPQSFKLMGTDGKLHEERHIRPAPTPRHTYPLKTCSARIEKVLAERLVRVWDSVLLETRPDAGMPLIATDGMTQHFASNLKYTVVTGRALGIDFGSRPSLLGRASYDLKAICWEWKAPVRGALDPHLELEQTVKKLEGP
jgi:hypothetical protein